MMSKDGLSMSNTELKISISVMLRFDCDHYGPPNGGLILTL